MTWTKITHATETGGGFLETGFLEAGFLEAGGAWTTVDKPTDTWTTQSETTETWTNVTKAT